MGKFTQWMRKIGLGRRWTGLSAAEAAELREAYKARYHNFKLLLAANNKALEIMSDLEEALRGRQAYGLAFIRAQCTAVIVNVFRMVQNLNQIAPGKYAELFDRIKEIQSAVNQVLSRRKPLVGDHLVLPFREVDKDMADLVGSKMANLGQVANRLDLKAPDGFVMTSLAYQRFFQANDLQTEIDRRLQSRDVQQPDQLFPLSAGIQQLIIQSPLPDDLAEAITSAYRALEARTRPEVKVSLRSSALGEDTGETSFAGQYRSELNVSPDLILESYKEIVASKYSLPAIMYRLNRGILDEEVAMCVGCLAMIDAQAGGVTYSRNPLNIRDDAVIINSVWGLPKAVVDGTLDPDRFVVARTEPLTITRRDVQIKTQQFLCFPDEGVCRLDVTGDKAHLPSLTDDQVLSLAGLAVKLDEAYGYPQDIEWAVDHQGEIFTLQCRPLKQMEVTTPEAEAARIQALSISPDLSGGQTASPGVGAGEVFLVRSHGDSLLFPQGAVLVTSQALPRWAALLSRAAAVITEQGSVAGHLANVAREFGVPAIVGLTGATERLTPGRLITVDADGLAVYPGRVEELLGQAPQKNLMAGSPVHEILTETIKLVVPLELIDPDSREFRPKSCRTLHDITRFCHEMSVREMFSFGTEHHFSERASKQLVCDVPMLWWIINLDDGFKEDVPGKFVHLDKIVSIPMLALWAGITAVPWAGPPPMDTKGFMSVLLEASANPELESSMPSSYLNRNYFMISKNFCNLTSRFGFHFCTIESLTSDRSVENYISFQFKGGAADFARRLRRAEFVGGIVAEFDFKTEIKEDGLFARVEGLPEMEMIEKLKCLGYLIIHTRQLDMVMANDAACQQHREKILNDIRTVVLPGGRSPDSPPKPGEPREN